MATGLRIDFRPSLCGRSSHKGLWERNWKTAATEEFHCPRVCGTQHHEENSLSAREPIIPANRLIKSVIFEPIPKKPLRLHKSIATLQM